MTAEADRRERQAITEGVALMRLGDEGPVRAARMLEDALVVIEDLRRADDEATS